MHRNRLTGVRRSKITDRAIRQVNIKREPVLMTQLIIVSSSSGSVVAAQTAYRLAEMNRNRQYFRKPFHLALGASMISKDSELFNNLLEHQKKGNIGKIIFDDLQDEGDSSNGVGSTSRGPGLEQCIWINVPIIFSQSTRVLHFLIYTPKKGTCTEGDHRRFRKRLISLRFC